jgi:hypothetical protein
MTGSLTVSHHGIIAEILGEPRAVVEETWRSTFEWRSTVQRVVGSA